MVYIEETWTIPIPNSHYIHKLKLKPHPFINILIQPYYVYIHHTIYTKLGHTQLYEWSTDVWRSSHQMRLICPDVWESTITRSRSFWRPSRPRKCQPARPPKNILIELAFAIQTAKCFCTRKWLVCTMHTALSDSSKCVKVQFNQFGSSFGVTENWAVYRMAEGWGLASPSMCVNTLFPFQLASNSFLRYKLLSH